MDTAIQEFYRERARYYDQLFQVSPWKRSCFRRTRELIARHLPASAGWASDLGCGTGLFSIELAQKGWNVVAVDLSRSMLDVYRARIKVEGGSERILLCQTDLCQLPLDFQPTFDLIFCLQVLNFIPSARWLELFQAIHARLPPDGQFIADIDLRFQWTLLEVLKGHPESAAQMFDEGVDRRGSITGGPYWMPHPEQMEVLFRESAFEPIEVNYYGQLAAALHILAESKAYLTPEALPPAAREYLKDESFTSLMALEERVAQDPRYRHAAHWMQFVLKPS
jgi:SAM-dependent methyltransferase